MTTAFRNKIWLVWLPAHSSHITQPLDVGVFSSLKSTYRTAVDDYFFESGGGDSSKETFLQCYCKARKAAQTIQNIRSGWRATGLWPVNIQRPLENPLLPGSKNFNQDPSETSQPVTPTREEPGPLFETPSAGAEVREQLQWFRQHGQGEVRDQQLFTRKIAKALDMKNVEMATLKGTIRAQEHTIARLRPRKRMKVATDPNGHFSRLPQVREAQERANRPQRPRNTLDATETFGIDRLFH